METRTILEQFNILEHPAEILDILIVIGLTYLIWRLISHSRALRILYGIAVLAIVWFLGRTLNLVAVNALMQWIVTTIVVAIPVVFQPELRQALEKVGRSTRFVTDLRNFSEKELNQFVSELTEAVRRLTKHKLGALIVISRGLGIRDYLESGVAIDGRISAKLISSIFQIKSPLHDGALVIEGNKIAAAGVTLPLAQDKLDQGTRHRAALGISQEADVLVVVVSEEDHSITLAYEGALIPVENPAELNTLLPQILAKRP